MEALRKATAKVHHLKTQPEQNQVNESEEAVFPVQEARQKRGGNKLRKRTVAECLKVFCEPVGKANLFPKTNAQVKRSANGFSHQFVRSKVNNDLMDSIKSDLNKYQKYFVSKSEENSSDSIYSKYFSSTTKKHKKPPTMTSLVTTAPTALPVSINNTESAPLTKQMTPEQSCMVEDYDEDFDHDSYFESQVEGSPKDSE